MHSVHWANGFCYSINICQEPKGVACYFPKPSTARPLLHDPAWCANNLLRSYGCLVRPLRCQWRRFIALSFAIDNTHPDNTHTHTKQKRPDKTRQRRRLFKGKGGEGSVGWGGAGHSQKLVQKFMISDKSTFPPVIYSARAHPSPFHRMTPLSVVFFTSLAFFRPVYTPFHCHCYNYASR